MGFLAVFVRRPVFTTTLLTTLGAAGLRTLGRIETPNAFNELVVADRKDGAVHIRDLATVVDGEEEPRTLSRLNGKNAISLIIRKQSDTPSSSP